MWTTEQTIDATVPPGRIWRAWTDVERWPEWNADIERIKLDGPFAVGTTIAMTPRGQETVELRLADVEDGERFVDEATVAGTLVRTTHRIDRIDDERVRVTYRLEATGDAEDELGPAVSADFADVLAALVAYAG